MLMGVVAKSQKTETKERFPHTLNDKKHKYIKKSFKVAVSLEIQIGLKVVLKETPGENEEHKWITEF